MAGDIAPCTSPWGGRIEGWTVSPDGNSAVYCTVKFKALKPLKDTALITSCQSLSRHHRLPPSSCPRHVLDGWRIPWSADREGGERETGEDGELVDRWLTAAGQWAHGRRWPSRPVEMLLLRAADGSPYSSPFSGKAYLVICGRQLTN